MASQNNDVQIGIHANVTGRQEVEALSAAVSELLSKIKSAGASLGFMGANPLTGSPTTTFVKELGAGLPGMPSTASIPILRGALDVAQERALQMGLIQGQNPPPRIIGEPGLPVIPSNATPMGPVFGPTWTPLTTPALPPPPPGGYIPPSRATGGAWQYGLPALPPPGGTVQAPGVGPAWSGSKAIVPWQNPAMGPNTPSPFGPMPANMSGTIQSAARDAARSNMSPHMMYGLMFQAFFGILFGGFQEYTASIASGKAPPAGAATMLPAALSLLGMVGGGALGSLVGNPMLGAMAGGFSGQLGGDVVKSILQGRRPYETTLKGFGAEYGELPGLTGPGRYYKEVPDWLKPIVAAISNVTGATEAMGWATETGAAFRPTGYTGAPGKIVKQLEARFGKDQLKEVLPSYAEFSRSYYMNPYVTPTDGGRLPGYSEEGAVTAYLTGGEKAWKTYIQGTGRTARKEWESIAPIVQANAYATAKTPVLTAELSGATSTMDLASRIGPLSYSSARNQVSGILNEQAAVLGRVFTSLSNAPQSEATSDKMKAVAAQLTVLANQIQTLRMSSTPQEPGLAFSVDVFEQQIYAAQKLPLAVRGGLGSIGRFSGPEITDLLSPLGKGALEFGNLKGSTRQIYRQLAAALGEQLEEKKADWERKVRGVDPGSELYHNISLFSEREAWPIRQALINTLSAMSEGWQGELISTEWNTSPHAARVMKRFNYARSGEAYEGRFGEPNRMFGGRMGVHDIARTGFDVGGLPPRFASDATTGRGPLVNVSMNVTVQGHLSEDVEKRLSTFKDEVAAVAGKTLVPNA